MNLAVLNKDVEKLHERLNLYQDRIIKMLQEDRDNLSEPLKYHLECYEITQKEIWKITYDTNYIAEE